MGRTGVYGALNYGWETTFKTLSSSRDKTFGLNSKVTSLTISENADALTRLGTSEVIQFVPKKEEGTFTVEYVLSNSWIFKSVLGNVVDSGASAPYTHTYSVTNVPVPFSTEVGGTFDDEAVVLQLKGCVPVRLSVATSVNEMAVGRLECMFADPDVSNSAITQVTDNFSPYTFVHGSVQVPSGTTIAEVQSIEFSIGRNYEFMYGLGNPNAVSTANKRLDLGGRVRLTVRNDDFVNRVLSRTEVATMNIAFDNGLSGSSKQSLTISLTGVMFDEFSTSLEPNEIVFQDLPFKARQISVVAQDNISTTP